MKIAYFDCFSGISGDMCLGALISAGLDFPLLTQKLQLLNIGNYQLREETINLNGISATNFYVDLKEENKQPCRHLKDILKIIEESSLSANVKEKSSAIFEKIALAESKIHNCSVDKIHFHEVGGIDSIIDIVGTVLGIELLGIEKIYASALPLGKGFINCQHGIIPNPAPATLELLKDVLVYGVDLPFELVTPTGAGILVGLKTEFTPLPYLNLKKVGYGSGKNRFPQPNLLRIILGEI